MKLSEIFTSIQGESSYAGLPCHFIRLSGCNLRCLYCDTTYSYYEDITMSPEEILQYIKSKGKTIKLVEITGGEPLLQSETLKLINMLINEGYKVLLETNGTLSIRDVHKEAVIIMDVKTPGSAMSGHNLIDNIKYLKPSDEVKFVITDRLDYDWSKDFASKYLKDCQSTILFSPSYTHIKPLILAQWIIDDNINVRLNLQLHKLIFGEGQRGV